VNDFVREGSSKAMQRVLVLFAHPAAHHSRVHHELLAAAHAVEHITVHDLYEAYPDFDVNIRREQELLLAHDVIVWQHPFYWYSTPPLVKQWQDLVLEHGWAYGRTGHALQGKVWCHAVSAGGGEQAYQESGRNRHTVQQLLAPLQQTAQLCGMRWLPPFVVHGTHVLSDVDLAHAAADYGRLLRALRDGHVRFEAAETLTRINADFSVALGDTP
jgi:glutathione-regulated potassium-efflux system ancillary protein KefG